jgi:serine phosphatase RsbU (regulator of sigma subunit)
LKVEKGDMVYLFSDGYADQFGGASGKKFKKKQFKATT